jgi:hypothetical protein
MRQVLEIRAELHRWQVEYAIAAAHSQNQWLAGKFADREAILADAIHQLDDVAEALSELPRLSS